MRAVPSQYREVVTERGMRVRSRFETNGFGQVMERVILDCPGLTLLSAETVSITRDSTTEFRHAEE